MVRPKKDRNSPPSKMLSFFRWFCRPDYLEDLEGDLRERFANHMEEKGVGHAKRLFTLDVLRLFRSGLIRSFPNWTNSFNQDMFKNNLKIAFRHIWDQKLYSSIKIGGLSLGIGAFLILGLYLKNEFGYDDFYPNKDRMYRVTTKYLGEGFQGVDFPAPFSKALQNDFPEVEKAGRYIPSPWFNQIRPEGSFQNFFEEGAVYVDVELLEILDIPLVHGDYSKSFTEPNSVLISESKARKYFPGTNPINQRIVINNNLDNPQTIVGVFQDFPENSHLDFDFMLSLSGVEFWPGEQQYWGANMYDVYILLKPGVDLTDFEGKVQSIITDYFLPSYQEREFANPIEIANNMELKLQPIEDIYLESADVRDNLSHGNEQILWLFGFSGILIIIIAAINFVNLSTARYSLRAKEIGMRKVVGADRSSIVKQFLTEAVFFSLIAAIIGLVLAWIFLPFLNSVTDKSLHFSQDMLTYLPILIGSAVLLGLVTGSYPSFYLSKLGGMSMQGPKLDGGNIKSVFRSSLVIFQFAISVILIICTIVVYEQMQFVMNKDLGFEKDKVVLIKGTDALGDKVSLFKEEILQIPHIRSASISDYVPVEEGRRYSDSFWKDGKQNTEQGVNAQIWRVDHDYIETMGLEIFLGRGFEENNSSDSTGIIISKSLMGKLSLDKGIGSLIGTKESSWRVIGVMKDFHFESLENEISPSCLILAKSPSIVSAKVSGTNTEVILSTIEKKWSKLTPTNPFRYSFLDERFEFMHKDISRAGRLFNMFAILAIFIACLGLFSLTTFMADRSKKEIGIRKVLGASVLRITKLLSKDFIMLVLIGILIAIPVGWYIMNGWLNDFAYRVSLDWRIFVKGSLLALGIGIVTISYQCVNAALQNPVNNLRS